MVFVNSSNKMVMAMWSASSYPRFDICETLSINSKLWLSTKHRCQKHRIHCSSSCILSAQNTLVRLVKQFEPRCCGGDKALRAQRSLISHCFTSLRPILSTSFSCNHTLNHAGLAQLLFRLSSSLGRSKRSVWILGRCNTQLYSPMMMPAFLP